MAQNSLVTEDERGQVAPVGVPGQVPSVSVPPASVPAEVPMAPIPAFVIPERPTAVSVPSADLPATPVPDVATGSVTDDDRHVYGQLLDRAFERGLLGSFDYEVRLRELSEATSVEQMKGIVTELPAFVMAPTTAKPSRKSMLSSPTRSSAGPGKTQWSSPWTKLIILVVVVVVALIVLSIFAQHIVRTHTSGSSAPAATRPVSSLRL